MIVVDTNLLTYLLLPGTHREAAERILTRDPDWAAPPLWRSELRNALIGYVRRSELSIEDAVCLLAEAEILMIRNERGVPTESVMRLAASSGCTAYDCEFVALAHLLGVPLVTSDKQVLKAFPSTAVSPEAFAAS